MNKPPIKEKLEKLTAAQKIELLENMVIGLDTAVRQLANSMTAISQALKILGGKVDAIVTASSSNQQITEELISKIVVEQNVLELKSKLNELISEGRLVPAEELGEDGFFVGREIDLESGKVENPRVQMAVATLVKDVREKLLGKKVGDTISFGEGKLALELEEVYKIKGFDSEESEDNKEPTSN